MAYGSKELAASADPTRQALLQQLRRRPKTVGELAEGLPVTRPAVSQHLKILRQARLVTVTTRAGDKYVGRIRNEDNFSVQLQTLDGIFHFLLKSEIEGLEYGSQSLMPSNFGSTLSPDELNDVVSYLMSLADAGTSPSKTPEREFEEE